MSGCGASGGNVLLGPGSAIRLGAGQPGIRRAAFVVGVGHPDDPWDRYGLGMDGHAVVMDRHNLGPASRLRTV